MDRTIQAETLEAVRKAQNLAASEGRTDSSTEFRNGDLTRFLGWCEMVLGQPEKLIEREIQAAEEDKRGDTALVSEIRGLLRKLGQGEGYALSIAARRGLPHLRALADATTAECRLLLGPLRAAVKRLNV